jgi:hypothetical protein
MGMAQGLGGGSFLTYHVERTGEGGTDTACDGSC